MGLFKTQEEKERIAAEKAQALLAKYGVDCLSDQKDINAVRNICNELAGTGLMTFGSTLGGDEKGLLISQTHLQRAIIEQNFIIIRQLDKIASILSTKS